MKNIGIDIGNFLKPSKEKFMLMTLFVLAFVIGLAYLWGAMMRSPTEMTLFNAFLGGITGILALPLSLLYVTPSSVSRNVKELLLWFIITMTLFYWYVLSCAFFHIKDYMKKRYLKKK